MSLVKPILFVASMLPTVAEAAVPLQTDPKAELICSEAVEMGTPFKICVYAAPAEKMTVRFDLQKAFRRLGEINAWMSDWRTGTELSKVNEAAGVRAVQVRQELFDLLLFVRQVSEATGGAFDPTFNAFWGLYDFKEGTQREATDDEVRDRLPLVDFRQVTYDSTARTVLLNKTGMKLGLGGVGQGYGVDRVVEDLKKHYAAGYVDGSGDTFFWGKKPDGQLWITSVRDPRDKSKDVARVYGTDFAITTAGDDERFFMAGDRRVHHILDPKTGRPATASRQVTVIAPTATEADAFDTATFVMGPAKGVKVLESRGLNGIFVTEKGVTLTKGLRKMKNQWGEFLVVGDTEVPKGL